MLELRVLNGLQAGARLALGEGDYTLGATTDCDIVLAGPGVMDSALKLTLDRGRVTVLPFGGEAFEAKPGRPFQVGDLQLTVDHAEAPWPVEASWCGLAADATVQAVPAASPGISASSSLARKARLGFVMVVTACGSSMLTVAVPTRSGVEPRAPAVAKVEAPAVRQLVVALADNPVAYARPSGRRDETTAAAPGYWGDEYPDIPPRRLTARRRAGTVGAASAAKRLPFQVTQIVCGASPSISTADGIKLYEGGVYKGYRLERLSATQLRMQGPRRATDLPC